MLMNASPQVLVVQVTCVTTLLDHTDVNVHWDLLMLQAHRIHWIQSALVRKSLSFVSQSTNVISLAYIMPNKDINLGQQGSLLSSL